MGKKSGDKLRDLIKEIRLRNNLEEIISKEMIELGREIEKHFEAANAKIKTGKGRRERGDG